jgi:hypothetical protein
VYLRIGLAVSEQHQVCRQRPSPRYPNNTKSADSARASRRREDAPAGAVEKSTGAAISVAAPATSRARAAPPPGVAETLMLTSVFYLSLATCLQDPVGAVEVVSAPAPVVVAGPAYPSPAPYVAPPAVSRKGRVAFGVMPSLTFGVDDVPSASSTLFLGVRLRGDAWALGYQFTGTLGLMARGMLVPLAHRHHFTAVTHFKRRGYATLGGGASASGPSGARCSAGSPGSGSTSSTASACRCRRSGCSSASRCCEGPSERLSLPQVGL